MDNNDTQETYRPYILVVDDEPVNRTILSRILQQNNCQVVCVKNGDEAVKQAQETKFDMIMMDFHMPVMNGVTASKEIRQNEQKTPKIKRTPIIGYTTDETVESLFLEAGADAVTKKPATPDQIRRLIDTHTLPRQEAIGRQGSYPGLTMVDDRAGVSATEFDPRPL